ncbi:MAG: GAF domain-containing sensor histidine kinase [Anaerolineae bacterium]
MSPDRRMMRNSEQKIEWLFISLRWFLLLAVASVIGMNVALTEETFPRIALVLLIVGAVANMTAMIALLQNTLTTGMRNIMLVHDILLTLGFIASGDHAQSQILFISLIPITTAALRISWFASVVVAIGVVFSYWLLALAEAGLGFRSTYSVISSMLPAFTNGAILLVAGLAVGQIGDRMKQTLIAEQEARDRRAHQALRVAHQRASLIFQLASTLSATLNYERVLEAALDVSHAGLREFLSDATGLSQVGLILLFGMDESLYIAKSRGLTAREESLRFEGARGILASALRSTDPVVTDSPADDPELSQILKMRESEQAIVVPLRAGYENYGLLVLGSSAADIYTSDFRDLLVAICNQAVLALQNASLYQNLMDEKDRLVNVEEQARKKLARDLHDGPTQTIAAIAMRLNYVRLLVDQSPEEAMKELIQLEELARRTTKEIRQMLFTLRPLILESQGLVAALEQLCRKLKDTSPLPIHLKADRAVDRLLDKDAKGAIFYIVEEATTNARKHAEAGNLWIRLYQRGMNVVAEIEDDGKGFDVVAMESSYANRDSLGMINLRERAALVQGKTVISSRPGEGTKITVTVPVDTPQEDDADAEADEMTRDEVTQAKGEGIAQ